jgi:hypothetical protein
VIFRAINAALALTPIAATGAVLAGLAAYRPAEDHSGASSFCEAST